MVNFIMIAHEITHAVMDDALGTDKMNTMPTWFVEGTAEFMAGADERVKNLIGNAGGTAADPTKVTALINRASALLGGSTWASNDEDYAAGYVIVKYMSSQLNAANKMSDLMTAIEGHASTNGATALEGALGTVGNTNAIGSIANLKTKFDTNANVFIGALQFEWGSDEADVGAIGGSSVGGAAISAEGLLNETVAVDKADGQPMQHFTVVWPTEESINSSQLTMQIGANTGQTMTIKLQDMRASAIGIDSIDVSTSEKASEAIKKYDSAIKKVSSFRARLGAYQNRVEHTIANLNNTSENLTVAESRIRDVDMANEMSTFSKNNILNQAAQAMLVQANQQPQQVLQLLR